MKKLLNYIIAGSVLVLGFACEEDNSDEFAGGKFTYVGINSNAAPTSIFEGNGAAFTSVTIPVRFGSEVVPGEPVTVNLTVSGDAQIGTDYTLEGVEGLSGNSFSVTIPADTSVVNFTLMTVTNVETQTDRMVTFTIESVSNGASIGFPYAATYDLTIQDDDCAYELEADFSGVSAATEVYAEGDPYGPYDPLITYVDETTLIMNNVWDAGDGVLVATITVNPIDNSLTISGSGNSYAGVDDWAIEGTGSLSPCTGEMLFPGIVVSSAAYPYTSVFDYVIQF